MKPVPAYPSLSAFPKGSYWWALDQLEAGNEIRREGWPIEIRPDGWTAIWHLYCSTGSGARDMYKGFNSGVIGADNDSWGNLGMDSGIYRASPEDKIALDWQLVIDVTATQVLRLNAKRVPRFSAYQSVIDSDNLRLRAQEQTNRLFKDRRFYTRMFVVLGVIVVTLLAHKLSNLGYF